MSHSKRILGNVFSEALAREVALQQLNSEALDLL